MLRPMQTAIAPEFLRFLDRINQSVKAKLEIHLVFENYGTHKHPKVKKWCPSGRAA